MVKLTLNSTKVEVAVEAELGNDNKVVVGGEAGLFE